MQMHRIIIVVLVVLLVVGCTPATSMVEPAEESAEDSTEGNTEESKEKSTEGQDMDCFNWDDYPLVDLNRYQNWDKYFDKCVVEPDYAKDPPEEPVANWEILFKVNGGRLIGEKVVRIWDSEKDRTVIIEITFPLYCHPEEEVIVNETTVTLNGSGHIECEDIKVNGQLISFGETVDKLKTHLGLGDLLPTYKDSGKDIFMGKGVGVYFEGSVEPKGLDFDFPYPIVSYEQLNNDDTQLNDAYLSFYVVKRDPNTAEIELEISNTNVGPKRFEGGEQLCVRQEPYDKAKFQFSNDEYRKPRSCGVSLGIVDLVEGPETDDEVFEHPFSSKDSKMLYIGYKPAVNGEPAQHFIGEIHSIIVDPNDSCSSCFD